MSTNIEQKIYEILSMIALFPDKIFVYKQEDEKDINFIVLTNEEDIKRIIGKQGATANALRTILHSIYARNDKKTYLSILCR